MNGPTSLIWLILAGVLPLMALRDRLSPRAFKLLAAVYAPAAAAALAAWFPVGPARPPVPQDVPFQQVRGLNPGAGWGIHRAFSAAPPGRRSHFHA